VRHFTLRERLRYRFDTMMGRGTAAVIVWLFALSLAVVLVVASLVTLLGWAPERDGRALGFWDVAWMSLMRTMDAGTMGNDSGAWPFLLSMLAVTTTGIFVVGTLIGLISSAINRRLNELRKGRSLVVEHDHVVLLGWSSHMFTLVRELLTANASRPYSCITILAERDKVGMEDELRARIGPTGRTRLVCRTGSPTDPSDLAIIHPEGARAFVILPSDAAVSDVRAIKTLVALKGIPGRRPGTPRIIAALHDPQHRDLVRAVSRHDVHVVVADEIVARVMAQTARQPGLSRAYTELLDFAGNNIYFLDRPELVGRTFAHALSSYENASSIGIRSAGGAIRLNPPPETLFAAGDHVIVISDEVSSIRPARSIPEVDPGALPTSDPTAPAPDRILMLGWNRRAPLVLRELDRYAANGTTITVLSDHPRAAIELEGGRASIERMEVRLEVANPRVRSTLESCGAAMYHTVLVLADSDTATPDDADAGMLMSLLLVRALARASGAPVIVIAEVIDARTRELAQMAEADDAVVGDWLVSLLLAQLAENPHLTRVLDELFDATGCDMRLRPARDYVARAGPISFHAVIDAAVRRRQIAVGYQLAAQLTDFSCNRGVVLNPPKSRPVSLGEADRVIVIGGH
jgi:voltage-gated potassium channel Kch